MDEQTCPSCGGAMSEQVQGRVRWLRCEQCQGVFLARADLGNLVEAETDWHAAQSTDTMRFPRITADSPPPVAPRRIRAWVETLFG